MVFRFALLLLVFGGLPQIACTQENASETAAASPTPSHRAKIVLEMRQPVLSDKFIRLLHEHHKLKELPELDDGDVFDEQQTAVLLSAAIGERRGDKQAPELTLELLSGEKRKWALVGSRDRLNGDDLIEASLSDDGQSVEIRLDWARWKVNGRRFLSAMKATVPLDSHLVLHTAAMAETKSDSSLLPLPLPSLQSLPPLSELDNFADKIIGAPKSKTSSHQRFLVISPSIAQEPVRSARK